MKRRTKVLSVVAAVGTTATIAFSGIAQSGTATVPNRMKQLDAAPRRAAGPADPIVMGIWRNGKFHIVKLKATKAIASLPDGSTTEEDSTVGSPAEAESQLPPADPALARVAPTQAQIDDMKKAVDAEVAKTAKPAPGGPAGPESKGRPGPPPGPQTGSPPTP